MIDSSILSNAVNNSDKQKEFDIIKKIGAVTSEIYSKVSNNGIDKSSISQKIIIVENDDVDVKFLEFLKAQENMSNFVDGVSINSSNDVGINPFTGDVINNSSTINSVFGSPVGNTVVNDNVVQSNNSTNDTFEPKPINPSPIEATQVIPNISNNDVGVAGGNQTPVTSNMNTSIDKKSGGFVNLLILLVILVVITVVSIELGKFLYSIYSV